MSVEPKPPFNRLKQCRYGAMLYNVHDIYIGRGLDLYGELCEGEVEIFRQIVRAGDVVLDVGANIGAHTVALAQLAGPEGHVFAFEPQRIVYQTLCANIALNSLPRVQALRAAVGDVAGTVLVPSVDPYQDNNFGAMALGSATRGEAVPVVTIDSLNLPTCRLVKIDVEGMELAALKGAVRTIGQCRPALYVENDRDENSESLIRFIDSLDYEMYWHFPPLYNPDNFFKNPENIFGNIVSWNMLCVPRGTPGPAEGLERIDASNPRMPVGVEGAPGPKQIKD